MKRSTLAIAVLSFVLGGMIGGLRPMHSVMAQEKPQGQDWVIQLSKEHSNFDAYIFNSRTGEAFIVRESRKEAITKKD
ncbi:MAG: hypothetical protein ACRD3L_16200 [Terriglobales bacterium]